MKYLTIGKLPEGKKEAIAMKRIASFYTVVVRELYQ